MFNKFYQKTLGERHEIMAQYSERFLADGGGLTSHLADQMIENYLYNYQLPLGIVPQLTVNGQMYTVPMAIEEPSVIAAASNGAKLLGNIKATMTEKLIIGQLIFVDIADQFAVMYWLKKHEHDLLQVAAEASQTMIAYGGGPRTIWLDEFSNQSHHFLTLYLSFAAQEAMGANSLNTVLEHLSQYIYEQLGIISLMDILSNYATQSLVTVEGQVPLNRLHTDPQVASQIANKISLASQYAQLDVYRAATHNKGIMNGIDAVLVATGNDWRAVEAGVHAYAARKERYQALSQWTYQVGDDYLVGRMTLPMQVATVGGTLSIHPQAQHAKTLLGHPDARTLSMIVSSLGLAQNLAALKALVTDGIQKGHMALQARALAIQAGAQEREIDSLVAALKQAPRMDLAIAKDLLDHLRQ